MTKKYYIKLASQWKSTINAMALEMNGSYTPARLIIEDFCKIAIKDNPRFDKVKFQTACGL